MFSNSCDRCCSCTVATLITDMTVKSYQFFMYSHRINIVPLICENSKKSQFSNSLCINSITCVDQWTAYAAISRDLSFHWKWLRTLLYHKLRIHSRANITWPIRSDYEKWFAGKRTGTILSHIANIRRDVDFSNVSFWSSIFCLSIDIQ